MPEEALRLNPQIDDHSELIKELAERYLYLLKKKSENEFEAITNKTSSLSQQNNKKKFTLIPSEITIEGVIEKVIKAYDCGDTNQKEALQKSIEADLQNLDTNSYDEEEDEEQITEQTKNEDVLTEERATSEMEKVNFFSNTLMDNKNLPSLEEIKCGMMQNTIAGQKRKIPHITELSVLLSKGMFPKGVFDDDDEKLDRLSKHFVMLLPIAKLQLCEDVESNEFYCYFKEEFKKNCKLVLERIQNEHILLNKCVFDENEVNEEAKKLIHFINSKKEFGATANDIKVLKITIIVIIFKLNIFILG